MLSRNLLSIESGPASRMASKPILGWGWCAMQKAWLMKPNQFPGFKSRHHAGSFSIHRYKWNTGFARFHRKYLLGTFFKQFFSNILSEKPHRLFWQWAIFENWFCGEPWTVSKPMVLELGGSEAAFTPFPWWWRIAKSLAEILSDRKIMVMMRARIAVISSIKKYQLPSWQAEPADQLKCAKKFPETLKSFYQLQTKLL